MSDAQSHIPVLTNAVQQYLAAAAGETVLDATVGAGGHARMFANAIGSGGRLIGLDVDRQSLALARQTLADATCQVDLVVANFRRAAETLQSLGIPHVDVILADLGISSAQLDDPNRGFTFRADGPLDMRLDPSLSESAADIVNRLRERELSDLLYFNAQEAKSRRIAKGICEARRCQRITTTRRLVDIVCRATGVRDPMSRKSRIHPATRTFLALRMAVNDEIGALQALLADAPSLLRPGGRIAVISFHSVEDKVVKQDFRRRRADEIYQLVTNKPVIADEEERRRNPRSRSAKMRVALRRPDDCQSPEQIPATQPM